MTVKLIPIPDADLEALRQIRSVIADAVEHPAREAAIAAIDRIVANHGRHWCQRPECCKGNLAAVKVRIEDVGVQPGYCGDGNGHKFSRIGPNLQVHREDRCNCGMYTLAEVGREPRLIVDDPHSVKQVDPSPDAVKAWCAASGVSVPRQPAGCRAEDILRISPEAAPSWPQRSLQFGALGRVRYPQSARGTLLAAVADLYGFDSVEISRTEPGSEPQATIFRAGRRGRVRRRMIYDRDIVESPLPTSLWLQAIREVAFDLDAPDVAAKDEMLVNLLVREFGASR